MRKLLNFKDWITVEDAARYLSLSLTEEVTEADVLQLALDGHIVLSVHFVNGTNGVRGTLVPWKDVKVKSIRGLDGQLFKYFPGLPWDKENSLVLDDEIVPLEGVWELSMKGAERLDVEHRYQSITNGPAVTGTILDGAVVNNDRNEIFRLMSYFGEMEDYDKAHLESEYRHPRNFYPAGVLPEDAVLVVQSKHIRGLENKIVDEDRPSEKPIELRERTTLLVIIAALAKLAKIDLRKHSAAAATIESETIRLGARVAARTIENHLKRVPEALEHRTND